MKTLLKFLLLGLTSACLLAYSGGDGSELSPYEIGTVNDLIYLSHHSLDWNKYFIQTVNIDFGSDETLIDWDGDGTASWDTEDQLGFSPISSSGGPYFTGSYNGQGYTINGLYINRSTDFIGFMGSTTSATKINNVHLTNVRITGGQYTGALVGRTHTNTIENCSSTGVVTSDIGYVGGLIGYLYSSTLINTYSTCEVNGADITGGLVGNVGYSYIYTSYSKGTVNGAYTTGGLCANFYQSYVFDSFSTSNVNGTTYVGGFVGNCNSLNHTDGSIEKCYSTGTVTASISYGGLFIGSLGNYNAVHNSFYETKNSGITEPVGINNGSIFSGQLLGKSSSEMKTQSTFTDAGWDFVGESTNGDNDIWAIDATETLNSGYPYLDGVGESATPITLASFTATAEHGVVELSWTTASETNNTGFILYRNGDAIARIDGAGTTSETQYYTYTDATVVPGVSYTYKLADVDYAGDINTYEANAVTVTLGNDLLEADFVIGAAYPNPFNPSAIVPLELSRDAVVNAKVYTLTGREVATLANGTLSAGSHELRITANDMTTGLYLVRIEVENMVDVQKIAFVK